MLRWHPSMIPAVLSASSSEEHSATKKVMPAPMHAKMSLPRLTGAAAQKKYQAAGGTVRTITETFKTRFCRCSRNASLDAFGMAPARELPRRVSESYDYWDGGEQFTGCRESDELVSTASVWSERTLSFS